LRFLLVHLAKEDAVTQNVDPTPEEKETARGKDMPQDAPHQDASHQDAPNGITPKIEEELEPHFFACMH
jgi:hypothetical protein